MTVSAKGWAYVAAVSERARYERDRSVTTRAAFAFGDWPPERPMSLREQLLHANPTVDSPTYRRLTGKRRMFFLDGLRQMVAELDGTVHEVDPNDPDLIEEVARIDALLADEDDDD